MVWYTVLTCGDLLQFYRSAVEDISSDEIAKFEGKPLIPNTCTQTHPTSPCPLPSSTGKKGEGPLNDAAHKMMPQIKKREEEKEKKRKEDEEKEESESKKQKKD